jgi:hypothetical protein
VVEFGGVGIADEEIVHYEGEGSGVSSRKRMLSGSLMSIFIMVALIALNHKLGWCDILA